jgi:anionic cell wall polymer biosynthesis LytR-Cps2A-Psr (LCP) family protein
MEKTNCLANKFKFSKWAAATKEAQKCMLLHLSGQRMTVTRSTIPRDTYLPLRSMLVQYTVSTHLYVGSESACLSAAIT